MDINFLVKEKTDFLFHDTPLYLFVIADRIEQDRDCIQNSVSLGKLPDSHFDKDLVYQCSTKRLIPWNDFRI